MDDAEISSAVAAGKLGGLGAALDTYADPLFEHCRAIAPGSAVEAVQHTFIIAWEKIGGLTDPDRLYPWLKAVAENECLRQLLADGGAEAGAAQRGGMLPPGLPGRVLSVCADNTPTGRAYRVSMAHRAGPFDRDGFPKTAFRPARWRRRVPRYPRVVAGAAAALIALVVAAIMLLAHAHHGPLVGVHQDRLSAAAQDSKPPARPTVPSAVQPTASASPSLAYATPSTSPVPPAPAARVQYRRPSARPTVPSAARPTASASPSPAYSTSSATSIPSATATAVQQPTATPATSPATDYYDGNYDNSSDYNGDGGGD